MCDKRKSIIKETREGVGLFRERNVYCMLINFYGFFFFQAEDGIRDYKVTGVQTCALPIFSK